MDDLLREKKLQYHDLKEEFKNELRGEFPQATRPARIETICFYQSCLARVVIFAPEESLKTTSYTFLKYLTREHVDRNMYLDDLNM